MNRFERRIARPRTLRRATSQILSYYASSDAGREYIPPKEDNGGEHTLGSSSSSDYSYTDTDSDDDYGEDTTLTFVRHDAVEDSTFSTVTSAYSVGNEHENGHGCSVGELEDAYTHSKQSFTETDTRSTTSHTHLTNSNTNMESRTNGNRDGRSSITSDLHAHISENSTKLNGSVAKRIDGGEKHKDSPSIHFPSLDNYYQVPHSDSLHTTTLASNTDTESSSTNVPSSEDLNRHLIRDPLGEQHQQQEQSQTVVESSLSAPVLGHRRRTSSRSLGGNDKRRIAIVELREGDVVMNDNVMDGVNMNGGCMRTVELNLPSRQIPDGVRREHSTGSSDSRQQQQLGRPPFTFGRAFAPAGETCSPSTSSVDSNSEYKLDPTSTSATFSPLSRSPSSVSRTSTNTSNWIKSPLSSSQSLGTGSETSPNSFNATPNSLLARRGFAHGTFALVAPPDASPSAYTNLNYYTPPLSAPVGRAQPHVRNRDSPSAAEELDVAARNFDVLSAAQSYLSSSHQDARGVNSTEFSASPQGGNSSHHQRSQSEAVGSKRTYYENNTFSQEDQSTSNGDYEPSSNNSSIGGRNTRPNHQLKKSSRDIGIVGTSVAISPTSGRFIMDIRLDETQGRGEDTANTLPVSPIFQTPSPDSDGALTPGEKSSSTVSSANGAGSTSRHSTSVVATNSTTSASNNGASFASPSPFSKEMRERRRTQKQQSRPAQNASTPNGNVNTSAVSRNGAETLSSHVTSGSSTPLRSVQDEKVARSTGISSQEERQSAHSTRTHVSPTSTPNTGATSPSSIHTPQASSQSRHTQVQSRTPQEPHSSRIHNQPRSHVQTRIQSQSPTSSQSYSHSHSHTNSSSHVPHSTRKNATPTSPTPPSTPPVNSAPDAGTSSSYLYYQPGIHATAGPLPPPPRQVLPPGLISNSSRKRDSPPPRPPRLHAPGSGSGASSLAKKPSDGSIVNDPRQQQTQTPSQTGQVQADTKRDQQITSVPSPGVTPPT